MREVLGYLGVERTNSDRHHNHFHVNLRPPKPVPIEGGGSLLLAAGPAGSATDAGGTPAAAPAAAAENYDAVMSICQLVGDAQHVQVAAHFNEILPVAAAQAYFHARGTDLDRQEPRWVTLISNPSHGELVPDTERPRVFTYQPKEGYHGSDQMTFSVEVKGKKFKVIYSVDVTAGDPTLSYPGDPCPGGFNIQEMPAKGTGGKGSSLDILELPTDGPVPPEKLAEFHAALGFSFGFGFLGLTGFFGFAGGRVSFQNLEGGALGKTEGNSIFSTMTPPATAGSSIPRRCRTRNSTRPPRPGNSAPTRAPKPKAKWTS